MRDAISIWTLRFHNNELEQSYQAKRFTYSELPTLGRVIVYLIIAVAVIRRVQLAIDAYCGSQVYSFSDELRATIEFLAGLVLELLFYFINRVSFLKGCGLAIGGFTSVMDSSCYYYPTVPAIVPMYAFCGHRL